MLTQRTPIGLSGNVLLPCPSIKQRPMTRTTTSATLTDKRCKMNLRMLVNKRRPSPMATTMELKLLYRNQNEVKEEKKLDAHSSVKTKSDASLATSLPAKPIAIPTGANFNAGESLTPSPDMVKCLPRRFPAWIILTFVSGAHRAITKGNSGRASISSSVSLSNCVA